MRITDIKVFPVREKKLKAFISIIIDDCFMINDIKVIKGKEGLFISMPSRRKRNGKFKDIAHPLNNETRQAMEGVILQAYTGAVDGEEGQTGDLESPQMGDEAAPGRQVEEPIASETPVPRRNAVPADSSGARATIAETANGSEEAKADEPDEPDKSDKSLEEVAELHLRDSFWGT